jgi:ABC-2 type transport system ATP-binding protein
MCDTLLFIDKGRIVHHGDAASMMRGTDTTGETLVNVQIAAEPEKLIEWALTAPLIKIEEETKRGARLRIQATDDATLAGVLRRMIQDGLPVVDYHREERKLEDAFIDMLGQIDKGKLKT